MSTFHNQDPEAIHRHILYIREAMKLRGRSLKELSQKTGIAYTMLSKYLTENRRVRKTVNEDTLRTINEALGIGWEWDLPTGVPKTTPSRIPEEALNKIWQKMLASIGISIEGTHHWRLPQEVEEAILNEMVKSLLNRVD